MLIVRLFVFIFMVVCASGCSYVSELVMVVAYVCVFSCAFARVLVVCVFGLFIVFVRDRSSEWLFHAWLYVCLVCLGVYVFVCVLSCLVGRVFGCVPVVFVW